MVASFLSNLHNRIQTNPIRNEDENDEGDATPRKLVLIATCASAYATLLVATRHLNEVVTHLVLIQAPSFEEEIRWAHRINKPQGLLSTPFLSQLFNWIMAKKIATSWYNITFPRDGK